MTKQEAETYIYHIPGFTKKNPLQHTKKLITELGITGEEFKIIHVAGTNGKGSVCTFLSSVLTESGKKTGLFTSPHLLDINERIQIDRKAVSDRDFMEAFEMVKNVVDEQMKSDESHPTFFEFIFAMAMVIFKKNHVEYLVLETGLGGRLDATNVFEHPLLCVITSIGMDHMQYLGDTLEKIAGEKAGIIKKGVPVIFDGTEESVCRVFEREAGKKGAPIIKVLEKEYKDYEKNENTIDFSFVSGYGLEQERLRHKIHLVSPAVYQVQNAALVLKALEQFEEVFTEEVVQKGFDKAKISGRMEEVFENFYVDGAHNEPGMKAFLETVFRMTGKEHNETGLESSPLKKRLVFSALEDKSVDQMIELIEQSDAFFEIIVTQIHSPRAMDCHHLSEKFRRKNVIVMDNLGEVLEKVRMEKGYLNFCAGSLYLVSEVLRDCLKEREDVF